MLKIIREALFCDLNFVCVPYSCSRRVSAVAKQLGSHQPPRFRRPEVIKFGGGGESQMRHAKFDGPLSTQRRQRPCAEERGCD